MRYRRVYAEINLDAIVNNVNEQKKRLAPGTKVMAVIKADGYGHGAVTLARELTNKVDYFAVAILEEALELRRNGITNPILILSYTSPYCFEDLVEHDICPTVYTLEMAEKLSIEAVKLDKIANIHIGLDTGMTRIGFFATDKSLEEIKKISELPNIRIDGLFTHYAKADEIDKTTAEMQTARFMEFTDKLESIGVNIPIKHICNSAGIIELDRHFDMVRMGISLYGLFPSEEVHKDRVNLIPAMRLISRVISIKDVDTGVGIGYGHTYITSRPTRVATIPVGYADGYPRVLSSRGRVIINNQYAPIIGRVCMDQMMIDVTDIEGEINIEDQVVLIGSQGDCSIPAEEIGRLANTINYEIVCNISRRVPRVYYKDGKKVQRVSYLMNWI